MGFPDCQGHQKHHHTGSTRVPADGKSFELSATCQVQVHICCRGPLRRIGTRLELVISDCNRLHMLGGLTPDQIDTVFIICNGKVNIVFRFIPGIRESHFLSGLSVEALHILRTCGCDPICILGSFDGAWLEHNTRCPQWCRFEN